MSLDTVIGILRSFDSEGPLDPANAEEFKKYYIDGLHEKHGDVVATLALDIMVRRGARNAFLFSGTIGSGKSTELRRLAYRLHEQKHYCLVVDALIYLNPQEPIGPSDLLLACAIAAWEAYLAMCEPDGERRNALRESLEPTRWAWWRNALTSRPELKDFEASIGPTKLKGTLRDNPTVRERMRRAFEASFDAFSRDVNAFMSELADNIRDQKGLPETAKVVMVIDSLEQFGGVSQLGKDDAVLKALLDLFSIHNRHLRIDNWNMVYSVPPLLSKLAPGIASLLDTGKVYSLTSAHVFHDHSTRVDEATVDSKLVPLARRRVGETVVDSIIPEACMREIVITSGGDLRDLMRIIRATLLEAATRDSFPVSEALLESVFANLRRPYLPFADDVAARLAHVHANKSAPVTSTEQWFDLMGDLAQKRILLYINGQEWYDVHPLLRDALLKQKPDARRVATQ